MNADPIAPAYRWLEYAAFGHALEDARLDFLAYAVDARRVLILGEGDGRFLARLLEYNRHTNVTVIDSSARMIELARDRVPGSELSRVQFLHGDWSVLPAHSFDLVVSHFFLDVFASAEAEAVIAKVSAVLAPGSAWLISEFHEPADAFRQLHARLWLRAMYVFFAATTGLRASKLPRYRDCLVRYGFAEVDYSERRFGLIRSQVWRKTTSIQTAPDRDLCALGPPETPGCASPRRRPA
jgi:ubiquinone/menaquinone biosynthesis C-methylase UbiE